MGYEVPAEGAGSAVGEVSEVGEVGEVVLVVVVVVVVLVGVVETEERTMQLWMTSSHPATTLPLTVRSFTGKGAWCLVMVVVAVVMGVMVLWSVRAGLELRLDQRTAHTRLDVIRGRRRKV